MWYVIASQVLGGATRAIRPTTPAIPAKPPSKLTSPAVHGPGAELFGKTGRRREDTLANAAPRAARAQAAANQLRSRRCTRLSPSVNAVSKHPQATAAARNAF